MTLAGYFFIYLITPRDIYWHLRFSLNRLFLQLWPSAIFLFFVALGSEPFANQSDTILEPMCTFGTASQNGTKRSSAKKFSSSA